MVDGFENAMDRWATESRTSFQLKEKPKKQRRRSSNKRKVSPVKK